MSKGSGMVGFALAGLAAGIATWYLLGTKEGRANLDRAIEGINELSNTVKTKAREQMECASDKMDKAKNKINAIKEDVKTEVKSASEKARKTGKKMSDDIQDLAQKARQSSAELAGEAKAKAAKYRS